MRVGIVGARRASAGTGPFLARFAHQSGARVCAVLGTSPDSAANAAGDLGRRFGTAVKACDAWDEFLATRPDAILIASPAATHEEYLQRALDDSLHVYCEKPLLWCDDMSERAQELATQFRARGLHLCVGAQWPFTLATYRMLFPTVDPQAARSFLMLMSMPARREATVAECLPHPLSMLLAVHPDPGAQVDRIDVQESPGEIQYRFAYRGAGANVACAVRVGDPIDPTMTMGYGWDGRIGMRVRRLDGTHTRLRSADSGEETPLPEPVAAAVDTFVRAVRSGPSTTLHPSAVPGVRLLETIRAAVEKPNAGG